MKATLITLFGILLLAACTPKENTISESQDAPKNILVVKPEGGSLRLKVGEAASLSIEGNPTTGYTWQHASATGNVLVTDQGSQPKNPQKEGERPMVGAPSMMDYSFKGVKKGTDTITFKYRRSFEPESIAPVKTVTWEVTVE